MINIRSIKKLSNGDGLTLKAGKPIRYKSGWQVADEGIETTSAAGSNQPCAQAGWQLRRLV